MASTINATTSGIVTIGDSVATLALQTGGTTAVAIDTAQIVSLSKSLALLGSTSGSVTIAAPAVAGTTTITLPATSGTLLQSGTAVTVAQGGTGLTAGTSGGVPYFSGTSTVASSAALTANGVVYGGGAGNAPVSTAVGTTGQFLGANTGAAPTWQTPTAGAGGSDTQIQFNNSNALAGNSKLFYNSAAGVFVNGRTTVWNTGAPGGYTQAVTTSSGGPALGVISDFASDSAYAALKINKTANDSTTAQVFAQFIINATASGCGQINANGAGAAAFGSFSDSRLKQNIVDLPSQLSNLLALRPVEFDYIESEGGGHQIGFIAQEFETVFPDAVGQRSDGMKTLTGWSKTEAILVKAIQEISAANEALTARITALEAK